MSYRDRYGFMHHKKVIDGNPFASENGVLFSAEYLVLLRSMNNLHFLPCLNFLNAVLLLHDGKGWKVTPESDRYDFSHDNFKGLIMGLQVLEEQAKKVDSKYWLASVKNLKKKIPIFHRQLDHPRDFLFVLGFKFKILRPFTFWVMKLAAIVSAFQTHKRKTIAKTDGKIIGYCLCLAFDWKLTLWVMTKLLKRQRIKPMPRNAKGVIYDISSETWRWDNWYNVFFDYYNDENHPIVGLVKERGE